MACLNSFKRLPKYGFIVITRIRNLAVFLLICNVPAPSFADDIVSIRFQESYAGAHPQEFSDLLATVKAVVPAAMAYITGQWGLPNTLHHPFTVTITDVASKDSSRAMAAYVRSVGQADELRQALVVDLGHHMLYPTENLDSLLYHEMAHGVLRDAATGPRTADIPTWFNEGLAQSVTTEGSQRAQSDYKRWGHTDARAIICGLNDTNDELLHGEHNFGCYTQYYLAVQKLIQLGGKPMIPKIIEGLHDGIPLPALIQLYLHLDWAAFQQIVQQYTRDILDGNQPIP